MSDVTIGTVEQANTTGIKVAGKWYNLTKKQQADPEFTLPEAKDRIELEYHVWEAPDGKHLTFLDNWRYDQSDPPERQIDPDKELPAASGWLPDNRPVVTRLACLNSALAYFTAASEPMPDEQEVLGLAERFVTWATWGGSASASTSD